MAKQKVKQKNIEDLIANETIERSDMSDELKNAMLNYAVEVITDRALPNIYDGLKPVQRRILYEGFFKKYYANGPFIKCAKYVGGVVAEWSPHGDASAYLALVALAQPWTQRYPLIAFHGNVGSYDGDDAAHMRYCVTGDTLVNTNEGLIRIDELAVTSSEEDIINQLYGDDVEIDYTIDSRNKQNKAIRLFNSGKHNIIHITTEHGYELRGTYNHPVMVNDTWTLLENIKIGDPILINTKIDQLSSSINLIDEQNINRLFDSTIDNIDRILQSTKAIQKYFLQKYADQYAIFINNELVLRFESEEVCKQVQLLLLTFGIVCTREIYVLKINRYLKNFHEYINFTNDKKIQLEQLIVDKELIADSFITLPVRSIMNEEPQIVYSIRVDSACHSFTANGMINHNTEAKLNKLAELNLEGISNNAVDMAPNYSETLDEPTILPGMFPALLCNGTYGIAVGYTSNIPSHNLCEVADAIIAYLKNNDITIDELMKIIPGPDIATGSLLINNSEIKKLYETGKGNLSFKAKYTIETVNDTSIIHITELPPRVNKLKLIEKLRDICLVNKKIPRVVAINDLSADQTNIVIKLAKGAIVDFIIKALFKQTDLSYNISYIMRAVQQNKPIIFNLKEALTYYVDHRRSCLSRENLTVLVKAEQKKHMLLGLVALTKNLKKAIGIIESADNDNVAKEQLKSVFSLDDVQAEAILELKLRRLTKLNRDDILNTIQSLDSDIILYTNRKNNISLIDELIIQQCQDLKKKFGDKRRTEIIDYIPQREENVEEVVLVLTNKNTIKLLSLEAYENVIRTNSLREKAEVYIKAINARSNDIFVVILENGNYIKLDFNSLIAWNDKTKIIDIYVSNADEESSIIVLTAFGLVQKIKLSGFKSRLNKANPLFNNWIKDDCIIFSKLVKSADKNVISLITAKGLLHRFYEASLKEMLSTGKNGVSAINLDNDRVISAYISKESDKYISIYTKHAASYGRKIIDASVFTVKARNCKGVLSISFFKKNPGEIYALTIANNIYLDIDTRGKLQVVDLSKCVVGSRTSKPEDIDYDPIAINFNKGN